MNGLFGWKPENVLVWLFSNPEGESPPQQEQDLGPPTPPVAEPGAGGELRPEPNMQPPAEPKPGTPTGGERVELN